MANEAFLESVRFRAVRFSRSPHLIPKGGTGKRFELRGFTGRERRFQPDRDSQFAFGSVSDLKIEKMSRRINNIKMESRRGCISESTIVPFLWLHFQNLRC